MKFFCATDITNSLKKDVDDVAWVQSVNSVTESMGIVNNMNKMEFMPICIVYNVVCMSSQHISKVWHMLICVGYSVYTKRRNKL